jgi:hypothetical protein
MFDFPPQPEAGRVAVELPCSLLPEFATRESSAEIWKTDRDTWIIAGPAVTNPSALEQLQLPAGEAVVELGPELVPELSMEGV